MPCGHQKVLQPRRGCSPEGLVDKAISIKLAIHDIEVLPALFQKENEGQPRLLF